MKLLGIDITDAEWDYLMQEQSKGKELKVVDGKVVAVEYEPTQEELDSQKIAELKQLLASTDYKAIKYAEGLICEQDYALVKKQRQLWREEINLLEVKNTNK